MTEKIGKYRIIQDNENLRIRYIYTFSDIIGSLIYMIGASLGILILYALVAKFSVDQLSTVKFWFVLIMAGWITVYCLYILFLGLMNPRDGLIQINKPKGIMIIRDFMKKEIVEISSIASIYCEITEVHKPKQKYGMFTIGRKDGKKIECFIIRSAIPIDLGREIEKDIYETTRKLRSRIMEYIR